MKHLSIRRAVWLAWLAVAACAGATAAQTGSADTRFDDFAAYVEAAAAEWQVPGLAMVVVEDGEIVFEHALGVLEQGSGRSVDRDTLFSIGSTTKAFAAATLGILVDQGKIGWDSKVADLMPEFRLSDAAATASLRVRDLLTHSAGVPNTDVLWYQQHNDLAEILRRMRFAPMASTPHTQFIYQNVMYAAAGALVERLSGRAWPEFVTDEIFGPLAMDRTAATLAEAMGRSNVVSPHFLLDGQVEVISNASVDAVAAAGSVWSSTRDMARWLNFLLRDCQTASGRQLLSSSTCEELFSPQVTIRREMYPAMRLFSHKWFTYGLGWFQTDYRGHALDFHSGSIDGLVALAGLRREQRQGILVLANLDHAEVRHALMYRAFDLMDPRLERAHRRDWHREVKDLFDELSAANESREARRERSSEDQRPMRAVLDYAGSYADPFAGKLTVSPDSANRDALVLRWGLRECPLKSLGGDGFECAWTARWRGQQPLRFLAGDSGAIDRIELGGGVFYRTED